MASDIACVVVELWKKNEAFALGPFIFNIGGLRSK